MTASRVKVALISKWFHPVLGGGAERFRRYAPGLRERGVDLEVFTALHPEYPNLSEYEVIDGISITRVPVTDAYKDFPKLVHAAISQFQQRERKPDIVQVFSIKPTITSDLLRLRLRKVETVYVSTMAHKKPSGEIVDGVKNWLYLQASALPISRVIASSTVMEDSLVSRGVFSKHIEVISHGVDTNRFHPTTSLHERELIREKLGIKVDDQVVLFVGSILPRKNVALLIKIWPRLISQNRNIRLILVGPYQKRATVNPAKAHSMLSNYSDNITKLVENSLQKERIMFTGKVANVEEYMRAADLFVFPSQQEGMPNTVLEAMATGLPCVLTPFIGLPNHEFGEPGHTFILLKDYEIETIASSVNQLLKNKNKMATLGQSARQWVLKHMSIEKILDQYAAMYKHLAKNKNL